MRLREARFQNWRALSHGKDGSEHLICLGSSAEQVRHNYIEAFQEILNEEEQFETVKIFLEQWEGVADYGRWKKQDSLIVPNFSLRKNFSL